MGGSEIDDGGSIFPPAIDTNVVFRGSLTLRDYFAACSLPSLISRTGSGTKALQESARAAYEIADAMMERRIGDDDI